MAGGGLEVSLLHRRNRYPIPTQEAGDLLLFPIMAALAKHPMGITELARVLQLVRPTVARRIRELAKYGYVVQRTDGKWVLVVRLRIEKPLEPVGLVGYDPVLGVRSGGLNENPAHDKLPAATATPGRSHTQTVKVEPSKPANAAVRLSRYFRVPEEVPDVGMLSIGRHDRCRRCMKVTQLRYGGTVMCAGCARKATGYKYLGVNHGDAGQNETQRPTGEDRGDVRGGAGTDLSLGDVRGEPAGESGS